MFLLVAGEKYVWAFIGSLLVCKISVLPVTENYLLSYVNYTTFLLWLNLDFPLALAIGHVSVKGKIEPLNMSAICG